MLESGGWGGIAHYTYNLCQALSAAGCRVTLISATPYELHHLPRNFRLEAVIPSGAPYSRQLGCVAHNLRALRPALLHIQNTFSARKDWLPLLLLKCAGCPLVLTAHNILPHDAAERNAPGMRPAYRLIYALCDRIVVHSRNNRRELLASFAPSPGRVAVIPHGDYTFTDTGPRLDPARARRRLGIPPDHRVVLAFGAIRPYKGIPDLIEAFSRVIQAVPDAWLAVVGRPVGVNPEDYEALVRRLGLQHRVVLKPGYVPFEEIGHYFQAADIAVFPYRNIAQSGALQLAYAFAKPVVATRVGAFPETVQNGRNGLLVPPAAPAALAGALVRLLTLQPPDLRRMGRRSLALAEKQHAWEEIAAKTHALYRRVLQGRRA